MLFGAAGACAGVYQNRLNVVGLHWAFLCSGSAFSYGLLTSVLFIPPLISLALSVVGATFASCGLTLLRLKIASHNFTILTFAIVMVWLSVLKLIPRHYGGIYGLSGVPELIGYLNRNIETIIFSFLILLFAVLTFRYEHRSRIRVSAELVAENPTQAQDLGAHSVFTLSLYGALSGVIFGCFGVVQAAYVGFVGVNSFDIGFSIIVLSLAVSYSISVRFFCIALICVVTAPDLLKLLGVSGSGVSYLRLMISGALLLGICIRVRREKIAFGV